ncbi:uncharacterized protein LOC134272038 [Saccostrea cucullata]|uniref:uncharacterized protein LOC134272038 n=1 Tax=Saccostrea cuccullata TaxID=36930 RepID=UPI002ED18F78
MNAKEWADASVRRNCNDTHGYHCVPDKNFSSLIEFCYPLGRRIPFQKGNCLELAYTGILNHVKCGNFSYGCPEKDFFSNEMYLYPACLRLAENCFTADLRCLKKRYYEQLPREKIEANCTCTCPKEQSPRDKNDSTVFIAIIIVLCVLVIAPWLILFLCMRIRKQKSFALFTICSKQITDDNEATDLLLRESSGNMLTDRRSEDLHDKRNSKGTRHYKDIPNSSVNEVKGIFVDFTVEDSELFILLKRQCVNGVLVGFQYLNKTRVKDRGKHKILCQRDEDGCTLLHYAAQGGSIAILEEIMQTNSEVKIDIKCFRGQTVLDYAIKNEQKDMSEFLITKHKELLLDTCQGIKPIHWVAWHGDLNMFYFLRQNDVDLNIKTKNGLNILDIAIMRNKDEFCESMINNEYMIQDGKHDECGWNIAHYAAYANNVNVLDLLKSKNKSFIMAKTTTQKTTLHIACEYGHLEVAGFIIENFEDLLHYTDDLKWNAIHYAGKGGNLQVLRLLKEKGMLITSLTGEEKTVLHISCTHKQVELCRYVTEKFYNDLQKRNLINKKTTTQSWMAAHYIGVERKGDGSEEKIVDILFGCEANLSEKTKQGWSVLRIAIDHCNRRLVKHLLSITYRTKLNITREILTDYLKIAKDEGIIKILQDTLNEMTTK